MAAGTGRPSGRSTRVAAGPSGCSGVWLSVLVGLLGVATSAGAAPVAVSSEALRSGATFPLGSSLALLEDPEGTWSCEDVAGPDFEERFRPHGRDRIALPTTEAAHWLRFEVQGEPGVDPGAEPLLLYLPWSGAARAAMCCQTGGARPEASRRTADSHSILAGRDRRSHLVFPVPLSPEGPTRCFLRVQSAGALVLEPTLCGLSTFADRALARQLPRAALYGMLFANILFAALLYLTFRDRASRDFVLVEAVVALAFFFTFHEGPELLPYAPAEELGQGVRSTFVPGMMLLTGLALAGVRFVRSFLETAVHLRRFDRVLRALEWGFGALILLFPFLEVQAVDRWTNVVALLTPVFTVVPSLLRLRHGDRRAIALLLGGGAMAAGTCGIALTEMQLVPYTLAGQYGLELGTAGPSMAIMVALTGRVYRLRVEQQHHTRALEQSNRALGAAVRRIRGLRGKLAVVEAEERRSLARELHDGVGQSLAVSRMALSTLASVPLSPAVRAAVAAADAQLARAGEQVRALTFNLAPPYLHAKGLVPALHDLCRRELESRGLDASVELFGELPPIPASAADMLYRIARELVFNVVKHARARRVEVSLLATDSGLSLMVADDGVGFRPPDPETLAGTESFGLRSVFERAGELDGSVEIDAAPGQGCRVSVHVPWPGEATGSAGVADSRAPGWRRAG